MKDGGEGSLARPAPDFPPFRPLPPWFGGDLQTLRTTVREAFGRAPARLAGPSERLSFPMPDGSGDVLLGSLDRPSTATAGRPLAILIHGLTGDEDGAYMHATATALLAAGLPVLRLNLRGAGASRPLCRGTYHAGRSEDLRAVVARLPSDLARDGVVLVGYSLGANMLLKFLGERDSAVPVRAAAAISAPIDLAATSRRFLARRNALYHRWLLDRMKAEALATPDLEPAIAAAIPGLRSTLDFDEVVIAPRNGFADAADYHDRCSAVRHMGGIRCPTLVIHALDDPWIPATVYTAFPWPETPALVPLLPRSGGHLGFHDRGGAWHDRCLIRFLACRLPFG
ncbi:MAG: YheT family hydrolase [Rhodospirillales bacterium]|jgi:predicted alpha/beta-fold hydrolase